ncbi:hypothetical protein ABEB36_003503 [Hypothenemus hampei]|uniref:Uncharacterized protein n=1 Tax=Hypothenemus hampei TaxID=57062 RepID=A0ABD1F9U8_HYPHA
MLLKCYGIGNVPYPYAIDLFHKTFSNIVISKEALRKLVKRFTDTGSVMDLKKRTMKMMQAHY